MSDSEVTAAARRLVEDHKLYFADSHDQRCQDTILVATWALGASEREERLRADLDFAAAFWRPVARDMEADTLSVQTIRFLAQDFLVELHRRAACPLCSRPTGPEEG